MIAGKLMVFRGEDVVREEDVLIETTDFRNDGMIELKFRDAGRDYFLRFFLHEQVRDAMANHIDA